MAKIQANTISGAGVSNVRAPYTPPGMATGHLGAAAGPAGAAIAAGVRPYDAMNANIDRLTRQRIANGDMRTREMQGAIRNFAGGVGALLGGIGKVMDRRADEQADAAISDYTRHLMAGEAEDFATPVTGDLAADLADGRQKDAVNGPYRAVARRIADYDESNGYKALSSRARERFEEKRRRVDDHFLGRALTQDIAARNQLRDAQRAEEARTKTELAASQALDAGDPEPGNLIDLAEDAIDFSAKEMARRMRILTPNGEIVPGAESVFEDVRRKASDAVYMDIWSKMAQAYVASDDDVERGALKRKMLSMVGARTGHDVRDLLDEDGRKKLDEAVNAAKEAGGPDVQASLSELLKTAAGKYPFSDEAARAGWDLWQKAESQLKTRLERERVQLYHDTENLEYDIFTGKVDGDPFDAAQKASEMRSRLPAKDQDAIQKKVAVWTRERALVEYNARIKKMWQSGDPDKEKAETDAIMAELKESDDPELVARVQSLLAGASRGSGASSGGPKWSAERAVNTLTRLDLHGAEALTWLSEVSPHLADGAYGKVFSHIKDEAFRNVNPQEVIAAAEAAGFNLGAVFQTDPESKRVVTDKNGMPVLVDPEGTTSFLRREWTTREELPGRWESSNPRTRTVRHEDRVELSNQVLYHLYETCAKYQAAVKLGKAGTLADFISKELAGDRARLEQVYLQDSLDETDRRIAMEEAGTWFSVRGEADPAAVFDGDDATEE